MQSQPRGQTYSPVLHQPLDVSSRCHTVPYTLTLSLSPLFSARSLHTYPQSSSSNRMECSPPKPPWLFGGVHTLVSAFSIVLTILRALSIMDLHISAHMHPQSVVTSDQSMKKRSQSAQHQKMHLRQEMNIAFRDTGRSYHVPTLQGRVLQIPGTSGPISSCMSPNGHSQGITLDYSNKHYFRHTVITLLVGRAAHGEE